MNKQDRDQFNRDAAAFLRGTGFYSGGRPATGQRFGDWLDGLSARELHAHYMQLGRVWRMSAIRAQPVTSPWVNDRPYCAKRAAHYFRLAGRVSGGDRPVIYGTRATQP